MADKVEIKRYRRLQEWDYSKGASLFITIAVDRSNCVRPVRPILATGLSRSPLPFAPLHRFHRAVYCLQSNEMGADAWRR